LSIIPSGQGDIMTGVGRRLRRFDAIAIATLSGFTSGVVVGIVMAALGYGVWSLIGQRLATVIVRALVLHERLRLWVMPDWHADKYRDIDRFSRISLFDRLSDNLNHLAFNSVVASLYGLAALGYVNIALRLIEPIRALVGVAAHNIAFSHFAAAQNDAEGLVQRLQTTASMASLFIVPIFAGLAAVMPIMLPIFAGPGWEPAIPIGIFLAIGSALALPARLVFSALSAKGRPEYSLFGNACGVAGTMVVLFSASAFGPVSVGVARTVGDAAQALVAILVAPNEFDWGRLARLVMLSKAWLLSAVMGSLVAGLILMLSSLPAVATLLCGVTAGATVYVGLLLAFAPAQLQLILARIKGAPTY
jgi:O-antigen/teichoic acid export membrane protein